MAIDSSVFAADIPAGTYNAGDVVPLVNIDGPANVRSGRGTAILKNLFTGCFAATARWLIHVKNSDWVDDMASFTAKINELTAFDPESGCNQAGHDAVLTPNSGWQVYAECLDTVTTTAADSIFALIDIDYPQVSSLTDPTTVKGLPASIPYKKTNATLNANGTLTSATWQIESIDYFKAGSEYALNAVEADSGNWAMLGFIAFSNAAGMGGLQRILPVSAILQGVRYPVRYASKLQKGPMDIKLKLFAPTATTADVNFVHDYVKRSI